MRNQVNNPDNRGAKVKKILALLDDFSESELLTLRLEITKMVQKMDGPNKRISTETV